MIARLIRSTRRASFYSVILLVLASLANILVASAQTTSPEAGRVVAMTFDDLPYANEGSALSQAQAGAAVASQRRIVRALRRGRVPATGFVNENKIPALGPAGSRLLAEWNKGLLALGNHGYSHLDSNDLDLAGIEREIVKGEATIRPMAAVAGWTIRYFRFPYNHVGDTEPKRVAIEALLARHGFPWRPPRSTRRITCSTVLTSALRPRATRP